MLRTVSIFTFLLLFSGTAFAQPIDLDRVTKATAPYLNGDTFALASVAVDDAWPAAITGTLKQYNFLTGEELTATATLMQWEGLLKEFREWGLREVSIVLSVADIRPDFGPLVVMTCENPDKQLIDAFVKQQIAAMGAEADVAHLWVGDALLMGSPANLARYQLLDATPRTDLAEGLKQATDDEASAGLVIAPGADVRRVIRELWPTLPEPFKSLDAKLLADGIQHVTLTIRKPPEWQARLALTASDEKSAGDLKALAERGMVELVRQASKEADGKFADSLAKIVPAFKPQQTGSELVIDLAHDNQGAEALVNTVAPMIAAAREAANRQSRMNDLKQIALAMHNFHAVNRSFPAAKAICDKEGKPLLSWRVAILPYVEEMELYKQFHFDEPWDSEHNLKLAKENMPRIYGQQMSAELRDQGKTTYLVPVSAGTGYAPFDDAKLIEKQQGETKYYLREGTRFQLIRDGTFNTIMCVQVADEHAVFWTKPDDWEPAEADPLGKLKQPGREYFSAAFMDGHVQVIGFDIDPKILWMYLTRAGGEVIPRD